MQTVTSPGAPDTPTFLSRLLGNNSNYIVINLSEQQGRLNASQTVRFQSSNKHCV